MADASTDGAPRCAYCATPIVATETLVEVGGLLFCCPNCELAAQNPEASRRARRGGGLVLTCGHCGTPIIFSEIMVPGPVANYCCPNCAVAAGQRAQPVRAVTSEA
jgi:hypothetical protein